MVKNTGSTRTEFSAQLKQLQAMVDQLKTGLASTMDQMSYLNSSASQYKPNQLLYNMPSASSYLDSRNSAMIMSAVSEMQLELGRLGDKLDRSLRDQVALQQQVAHVSDMHSDLVCQLAKVGFLASPNGFAPPTFRPTQRFASMSDHDSGVNMHHNASVQSSSRPSIAVLSPLPSREFRNLSPSVPSGGDGRAAAVRQLHRDSDVTEERELAMKASDKLAPPSTAAQLRSPHVAAVKNMQFTTALGSHKLRSASDTSSNGSDLTRLGAVAGACEQGSFCISDSTDDEHGVCNDGKDDDSLEQGNSGDRRLQSVNELLEDEKRYCAQLWTVLNNYRLTIVKSGVVDERDARRMFPLSLQHLYKLHCSLLQQLQQRVDRWASAATDAAAATIGDIFVRMLDEADSDVLNVYRRYFVDYPHAVLSLRAHSDRSSKFRRLLKRCDSKPALQKDDVLTLLLAPIQRMSKYVFILKNLQSVTGMRHPDFYFLRACLEKLDIVVSQLNENIEKSLEPPNQNAQAHITSPSMNDVGRSRSGTTDSFKSQLRKSLTEPQSMLSTSTFSKPFASNTAGCSSKTAASGQSLSTSVHLSTSLSAQSNVASMYDSHTNAEDSEDGEHNIYMSKPLPKQRTMFSETEMGSRAHGATEAPSSYVPSMLNRQARSRRVQKAPRGGAPARADAASSGDSAISGVAAAPIVAATAAAACATLPQSPAAGWASSSTSFQPPPSADRRQMLHQKRRSRESRLLYNLRQHLLHATSAMAASRTATSGANARCSGAAMTTSMPNVSDTESIENVVDGANEAHFERGDRKRDSIGQQLKRLLFARRRNSSVCKVFDMAAAVATQREALSSDEVATESAMRQLNAADVYAQSGLFVASAIHSNSLACAAADPNYIGPCSVV